MTEKDAIDNFRKIVNKRYSIELTEKQNPFYSFYFSNEEYDSLISCATCQKIKKGKEILFKVENQGEWTGLYKFFNINNKKFGLQLTQKSLNDSLYKKREEDKRNEIIKKSEEILKRIRNQA